MAHMCCMSVTKVSRSGTLYSMGVPASRSFWVLKTWKTPLTIVVLYPQSSSDGQSQGSVSVLGGWIGWSRDDFYQLEIMGCFYGLWFIKWEKHCSHSSSVGLENISLQQKNTIINHLLFCSDDSVQSNTSRYVSSKNNNYLMTLCVPGAIFANILDLLH